MAEQACSEDELIHLIGEHGVQGAARALGITVRNVHRRRRGIEERRGMIIRTPSPQSPTHIIPDSPARIPVEMKDGVMLIGSDSHYRPGIVSIAHRAFVKFNKEMKPKIVIKNGDELDFPSISRYTPIGWEQRPKVQDEIEHTQNMLAEVENANKNAQYIWPLGNHDARFETRLATQAPEYARVNGVHLKDHFPRWKPCWSVWVNDEVVIKHRMKGGIHATRNNTLNAGKTMVTGHLHSLKVTPLSDYNGTRWGVDTGTMADPYGPQFVDYTEDNPLDWRSGFVVLTFHKGKLLWPEVVHVVSEGKVDFRGKVIDV